VVRRGTRADITFPAVTRRGRKAFDKRLPDSEPKLRELFEEPQAKHGTVLVAVDQPASIGALPLTAAPEYGLQGGLSAGPEMIVGFDDVFTALDEQTVVVPGTDATALIVPSAARLAVYAGLASATRSCGSPVLDEQPSHRGNKRLKRAFPLPAFAALADPVSRVLLRPYEPQPAPTG
jgi:hypothetical protein